jgi:uncharacterized protein
MSPRSEQVEFWLDDEQLTRIDEWARDQTTEDLSRAAAIRKLIDIGLSAGSKSAVRFTDGEKILMLMMRDIFRALTIKDPESRPEFFAEVICGGHYWAPKWDMQRIFHDHADDPRDVAHVADVLDMWTFIEDAYTGFTPAEKAAIAQHAGLRGNHVQFNGFDSNVESGQMAIARFLIFGMGRFERFKERDLTSHHPTYERYRRMLHLFKPMRAKVVGHGLSLDHVVRLLKA